MSEIDSRVPWSGGVMEGRRTASVIRDRPPLARIAGAISIAGQLVSAY